MLATKSLSQLLTTQMTEWMLTLPKDLREAPCELASLIQLPHTPSLLMNLLPPLQLLRLMVPLHPLELFQPHLLTELNPLLYLLRSRIPVLHSLLQLALVLWPWLWPQPSYCVHVIETAEVRTPNVMTMIGVMRNDVISKTSVKWVLVYGVHSSISNRDLPSISPRVTSPARNLHLDRNL